MEQNNKIALFQEKHVRKVWHNEQWYFSVIDVVEVLTDSPSPKTYWDKLKSREFSQLPPIWGRLKIKAKDGRMRLTDCAHTEGCFVSSCLFRRRRLNHLNCGLHKWVKSGLRKLKTLKLDSNA